MTSSRPDPEDGATARPDALDRVMAEAFPQGVPESELELAARLPKDARDVVAARLRVVMDWTGEDQDGFSSVKDAAAATHVSAQRFYAMAADWRRERSIAGLGVKAFARPSREPRVDPAVRTAAVETIRDMMLGNAEVGVASAIAGLKAAGLPSMSRSMVRQLWLEARRMAPPGAFGAALVFDSVGLDAVSDGQRMRLFVVLDQGTRLVLGWAVATNRSSAWGHVHAADHAAEHLPYTDLSGFAVAAAGPSVVLNLQKSDGAGGGVIARRLNEAGIPCVVATDRLGRVAVEALGDRLGSVWTGVGERDDAVSYRNGRPARMPEYTPRLDLELEAAIVAYNRARGLPAQFDDVSNEQDRSAEVDSRSGAQTDAQDEIRQADGEHGRSTLEVKESVLRVLSAVEGARAEFETMPSYSEESLLPDA